MTNADKLLKDGVTIEDFEYIYHDWLIKDMILEPEREMQLNKLDSVMRFLRTPCKPTLTDVERVILRNIEFKDYNIIGRKESGDLYVNYQENDSFNGAMLIMFKKHLFQFIKERRRI